MQLAKVKVKTSQQGTLAFCGRRIPAQGGVPPYKSWSYLMRNEQANEIGGRVFYTDATGARHAIQALFCSIVLSTQRAWYSSPSIAGQMQREKQCNTLLSFWLPCTFLKQE